MHYSVRRDRLTIFHSIIGQAWGCESSNTSDQMEGIGGRVIVLPPA